MRREIRHGDPVRIVGGRFKQSEVGYFRSMAKSDGRPMCVVQIPSRRPRKLYRVAWEHVRALT